jgi:hypothetical protein
LRTAIKFSAVPRGTRQFAGQLPSHEWLGYYRIPARKFIIDATSHFVAG